MQTQYGREVSNQMHQRLPRSEISRLLDRALQLAEQLREDVEAVFPSPVGRAQAALEAEIASSAVDALDLDQKLNLGVAAAASMLNIAYQAAPELVIDALDADLAEHEASADVSASLLARVRVST